MFTKTFTRVTALLIVLALFGIAFAEKDLGEKEKNGYKVTLKSKEDDVFAGKATNFTLTITKDGKTVSPDTPPDLKLFAMVDGYKCPMGDSESEKAGKCKKCGMELAQAKIRKASKDKIRLASKPTSYEGKISAAGTYELDVQFKPSKEEKECTVTFEFDCEEAQLPQEEHPKGGNMPGGHKH